MTLTADPLKLIRDYLYNNWTESNPSKTDIGEGGFVVVPRRVEMKKLAITIRRQQRVDRRFESTGANPVSLTWDFIIVGVWTDDKTQKDKMLKEVRRILKDAKATPPTGILDVDITGSVPRDEFREREPVLGEEVRVRLTYEE